jgi:predicted thioredoxin/glutaredoxin
VVAAHLIPRSSGLAPQKNGPAALNCTTSFQLVESLRNKKLTQQLHNVTTEIPPLFLRQQKEGVLLLP